MQRRLASVLLLGLLVLVGGCVRVRYWEAKDLGSGKTYYTVDTTEVPIGAGGGAAFLSSGGKVVGLASYELTPISEEDYGRATNGGRVELVQVGAYPVFRTAAYPVPPAPVGGEK